MPYVHVGLPLPLFTPYTYRVPETLADRVHPGMRVVVPVRRQEMVGVVTAVDVDAPPVAARDLLAIPDRSPALSGPLLDTAAWVARYYGAPLGLVLRTMLPTGMWGHSDVLLELHDRGATGGTAGRLLEWLGRRGGTGTVAAATRALKQPVWDVAERLLRVGALSMSVVPPATELPTAAERFLELAGEPLTLLEREQRFRRRPRQRALYEALEQAGVPQPIRQLRERLGFSDAVIRALVTEGLARDEAVEAIRDPFRDEPATPPPDTLTADQAAALTALEGVAPGHGALLFGVTGSGKTLVYLELIRRLMAEGRGAILLVPEIGLTPQTVSRVRGMFGDQVAVLHSGLSDGERYDAWRLLHRGERRVAVGARSAVFAPVRDLGLIVVDEEHESSYKNGETPRYHAREVAARRAQLEGARLVLGSATPSLDTFGRLGPGLMRVDLPARVQARPLPPVTLVDLRRAPMVRGTGAVPWSEALDHAMAGTLERGEQVLLLLNRRGFASFLQCGSCGAVAECPRCSISLTVHQSPAGLRCHYCDYHGPLPTACAACQHAVQVSRGVGTQQLERLVAERFPKARLARMDLDTTGSRWSHHRILGAMERGEVDVLIGTQMIAKGIDLPEVTLVGVIDADLALHLPDFRAAERTFQLITQVAGRAGRGIRAGQVIVQTRQPGHHALVRASAHDVLGFLADELAVREVPAYPPRCALLNLVVSGVEEPVVSGRAAALADWCQALSERHGLELAVLGPAPAPIARLKERWRWHVLLKGSAAAIGKATRALGPRVSRMADVRIALDRDPTTVL